jgi:tetraacyldisaccharide 4'-kinase
VAAARRVLTEGSCDVVVSDDGLQALALARDLEVAVLDGSRRLGNGRCLPAGPLRERAARLRTVDLVVTRGRAAPGEFAMGYQAGLPRALDDAADTTFEALARRPVHAVAGIGNPRSFFDLLRDRALTPIEHPFPDHHRFRAADLDFEDDLPVVMTEKDAVKCRGFARGGVWYVPVDAVLDEGFGDRLLALLAGGTHDGQKAP